uniref:Uncharacterized protein n=1 Tax=Arundo donax TaxID=35708 RepID=A0A0A9DKW8_ARUDO
MATLPARSGVAENLSARDWSTARLGMPLLSCCRRASISATSDGRNRNAGAPVLGGRPIGASPTAATSPH